MNSGLLVLLCLLAVVCLWAWAIVDWQSGRRYNRRRAAAQEERRLVAAVRAQRADAAVHAMTTGHPAPRLPMPQTVNYWPLRPHRWMDWTPPAMPASWVQDVLPFRGAGPVFEEVRRVAA